MCSNRARNDVSRYDSRCWACDNAALAAAGGDEGSKDGEDTSSDGSRDWTKAASGAYGREVGTERGEEADEDGALTWRLDETDKTGTDWEDDSGRAGGGEKRGGACEAAAAVSFSSIGRESQ